MNELMIFGVFEVVKQVVTFFSAMRSPSWRSRLFTLLLSMIIGGVCCFGIDWLLFKGVIWLAAQLGIVAQEAVYIVLVLIISGVFLRGIN